LAANAWKDELLQVQKVLIVAQCSCYKGLVVVEIS